MPLLALIFATARADEPAHPADPAPAEPAPPPPDSNAVDEDALFGDPAAAPPDSPPGSTDLGDMQIQATTGQDILDRLGQADERLTVGGKLYLRGNVSMADGEKFAASTYSSPNLLDLFTDIRPNDRVRGFAQGRVTYDFTILDGDTDTYGNERTPASVVLDQLWLKFDVAHRVYVTTGRQRIKWGSGRFWNPTDFMNQQTLDALNAGVFDERTGVTLLKVHVPIEAIGANLYAVGNFDGADTLGQVGGAVRTEWVLGPSEVALSAATRKGDPVRLGADVSAGVGPLDLHVEAAFRHGDKGPFYTGDFDLATFTVPDEVDRSDEWIAQVVAGAEVGIKYTDDDTLYLGAEYFYNGSGYKGSDLYPYLLLTGNFTPFYLGKQYIGAYLAVPSPGRWNDVSFTASQLGNLSDKTWVSRLDVSGKVNTFLSLNVYGQVNYGENGEFHFSLHEDPVFETLPPGVGFTDAEAYLLTHGLDVPATIATFGAGATVNF